MARTKYYHADEVGELLGITIDEVRVMLKNKELKGHKLGRRWLIDMEQPCFEKLVSNDSITKKQEPIFRYIKDEEHEEMFRKYLFSVKKSLYISTGDFKTVYFDGEELASILNGMANRGIEVVVKCMNPYGHDKLECDFDLVVCDRCIWVVPRPRQHSITRKCKPHSRIWGGYRERMCMHIRFSLFIADAMLASRL